jgi:hypothetical protein
LKWTKISAPKNIVFLFEYVTCFDYFLSLFWDFSDRDLNFHA